MSNVHNEYLVTGQRSYRGHEPGSRFHARIDRAAEARAVARGDIKIVRQYEVTVVPGTYEFPAGWLADEPESTTAGGR